MCCCALLLEVALFVGCALGNPIRLEDAGDADVGTHNATDFENHLVKFLDEYYDRYVMPEDGRNETLDVYDQMQSDQPVGFGDNVAMDYNSQKKM